MSNRSNAARAVKPIESSLEKDDYGMPKRRYHTRNTSLQGSTLRDLITRAELVGPPMQVKRSQNNNSDITMNAAETMLKNLHSKVRSQKKIDELIADD